MNEFGRGCNAIYSV